MIGGPMRLFALKPQRTFSARSWQNIQTLPRLTFTSILMAALYLRALRFITSSNATPRTRQYMWMVLPAQSLLSLQWRETP